MDGSAEPFLHLLEQMHMIFQIGIYQIDAQGQRTDTDENFLRKPALNFGLQQFKNKFGNQIYRDRC